jgi:glycosyltransferase involved in cell wall biosynthesis
MAYGTPVIASRSGAIPEIVDEDVGLLFEKGNRDELAEKIKLLYENTDILNSLKSNIKKYVESNFTVEKMAERVLSVYNEIIKTNT